LRRYRHAISPYAGRDLARYARLSTSIRPNGAVTKSRIGNLTDLLRAPRHVLLLKGYGVKRKALYCKAVLASPLSPAASSNGGWPKQERQQRRARRGRRSALTFKRVRSCRESIEPKPIAGVEFLSLTGRTPAMTDMSSIREHMEVIGADGVHVGTV